MKVKTVEKILTIISTILWIITALLLLFALGLIGTPDTTPLFSPGIEFPNAKKWIIFGVFLAASLICNVAIKIIHKKYDEKPEESLQNTKITKEDKLITIKTKTK